MATAVTAKLDPELPVVQAILEGDRGAFEEFVRRHNKWVRGVVFGVLGDARHVDDVQQHVWSVVWQQAQTLKEARRWRTWLYRLARNAAVDAGREITRRRKLHRGAEQAASASRSPTPPDADTVEAERRRLVQQAVQCLPALYREPFVLRHLEGWSYQQIATLFDVPLDTVETRLVRARRQLREALKGKL